MLLSFSFAMYAIFSNNSFSALMVNIGLLLGNIYLLLEIMLAKCFHLCYIESASKVIAP